MASAMERQLILPFLAPSAFRSPSVVQRTAAIKQQRTSQWQFGRTFTSTSLYQQEERPRQNSNTTGITDELASLFDNSLDLNGSNPTAPKGRTTRFASRNAQSSNLPLRESEIGGSIDELLSSMTVSSFGRSKSRGDGRADVGFMLDPKGHNRPVPPPAPAPPLPIKLNASVGRTVQVNERMDPARAFRALETQCARNSVRRDFNRQRFHERPGLKRKRLKSERWRRRFREGFRGVVGLVQKMKAQGW